MKEKEEKRKRGRKGKCYKLINSGQVVLLFTD